MFVIYQLGSLNWLAGDSGCRTGKNFWRRNGRHDPAQESSVLQRLDLLETRILYDDQSPQL